MLDKSKLIAQLHKVADQLFVDSDFTHTIAHDVWALISKDPSFLYKVQAVHNAPWPVPLWDGDLGEIIPVEKITRPHIVLSVDGSQIYPDRHNVLSCFLINTGFVVLPYGLIGKRVELFSDPVVFAGVDEGGMPCTTDTVNCKRQEIELSAGLDLAKRIKSECGDSGAFSLVLFDGSLIFWHLSSKEIEVRDHFLDAYITLLDQMHQETVVVAWYISLPKSKELMSLVRLYLCDFNPSSFVKTTADSEQKKLYESVDTMVDAHIMEHFLSPYTRSIVFRNRSSISDFYPSHLRPFFFYIHTGDEIGRVEIPSWIAHDEQLVNHVASVVLDQCVKGGGYPVALAEAHEQAVIKGPDRDFFYHFLQKMIIERKKSVIVSRKSLKKRGIGI